MDDNNKGSNVGVAVYSSASTRFASPPRRPDDKDGHYVFELGENLSSRCNQRCMLAHTWFYIGLFFEKNQYSPNSVHRSNIILALFPASCYFLVFREILMVFFLFFVIMGFRLSFF